MPRIASTGAINSIRFIIVIVIKLILRNAADYFFLVASYVSIVLVTIVQVVSPFWKYCDSVVTERVRLQDATITAVAIKAANIIKVNKFFITISI